MTTQEISRRSVLKRGSVAGAAGLAVAAGGGGVAAAVLSSSTTAGTSSAVAGAGATTAATPIVIYLADPKSGKMDIYSGEGKTSHVNKSMAALVQSMAPKS